MPKTRQQKADIVSTLKDALSGMRSLVVTQCANMPIQDEQALRVLMVKEGMSYRVVKKTLLARVFTEVGFALDIKDLRGTVALAISHGDEVAPARVIAGFAKGKENFSIAYGMLAREGSVTIMQSSEVKQLAQLPGRLELLAKAVGSIAAPLSGMVNVLAGPMRGLVNTLGLVRTQKAS